MPQPAPKLTCAEQARINGAASRGPVTPEGKARSAQNGTRHGLRGGAFSLLPGEDADALAALRRCVEADWRPRDAYEAHWVAELVASMWRANRLRRLEVGLLDAALADEATALSEATVQRLTTFARYGARLDADLRRALKALQVLKERPDARVAEGTVEPDGPAARDNTSEPDKAAAATCTSKPEPTDAAAVPVSPTPPWPELRLVARDTLEPEPPAAEMDAGARPNRKARRRQQALLRQAKRA